MNGWTVQGAPAKYAKRPGLTTFSELKQTALREVSAKYYK